MGVDKLHQTPPQERSSALDPVDPGTGNGTVEFGRWSDASSWTIRLKGSGIVAEDKSQDHLPKAKGHHSPLVSRHLVLSKSNSAARVSERAHTQRVIRLYWKVKARFYNHRGHGIRLQFGQQRRRNTPQKIAGGLCLFFVVDHFLVEAEGVSDGCHATSWGERSINLLTAILLNRPLGQKLQYDLQQLLSLLLNKMPSVSAYSRTWPSCGRRERSDSNDDDDEVKRHFGRGDIGARLSSPAQDPKRAPQILVPLLASLHCVAADSNPAQAANVMGPLTGSPDVHSSASASLFHQTTRRRQQ
jgi:hypothetical protein